MELRKLHLRLRVLFLFLIAGSSMAWAQDQQVSGTVLDSTGEPLIGVSVLQKNTTNGTITDFNGEFKLSVPANATLVFFLYRICNTGSKHGYTVFD